MKLGGFLRKLLSKDFALLFLLLPFFLVVNERSRSEAVLAQNLYDVVQLVLVCNQSYHCVFFVFFVEIRDDKEALWDNRAWESGLFLLVKGLLLLLNQRILSFMLVLFGKANLLAGGLLK